MTALHLASGLALMAAAGHSVLSERLFLRPLRGETIQGSVLSQDVAKKLVVAMFHLASLCWASMAISMVLLEPASGGYGATLLLYASIYTISGLGNFWAVGKPHFGGVLLLSSGFLILIALYA